MELIRNKKHWKKLGTGENPMNAICQRQSANFIYCSSFEFRQYLGGKSTFNDSHQTTTFLMCANHFFVFSTLFIIFGQFRIVQQAHYSPAS